MKFKILSAVKDSGRLTKVSAASLAVVGLGALVVGQVGAGTTPLHVNTVSAQMPITTVPTTSTTKMTMPPVTIPQQSGVFNVVKYGADPSGHKNSTFGIRAAIDAAQQSPGSTVFFPPGRYILQRVPNQGLFDFVINAPIHIVGSGQGVTTIVNEVGAKVPGIPHGTNIFVINSANDSTSGGGSGTTISNMTLDSRSFDAGTSIMDFGNHTVLSDLTVYAPHSTDAYNQNAFGVRVIAICNPTNRKNVIRVGNVVKNVTIIGTGGAGNTELDLSCQVDSSVDNVSITGNGMDIFYSHNDSISNVQFTAVVPTDFSWVITGSQNIRIANVTTNNSGGKIEPDPVDLSSGILVSNEVMANPAGHLFIGDVKDVAISASKLSTIVLWPKESISGVALLNTTHGTVACKPHSSISGLAGFTC